MSIKNSTNNDALQEAMKNLNAQWYNALTKNLNLSPDQFQLTQGSSVVGSLSENLWSIFDAVPPMSVNHYYDPSQINSMSSGYGSIITNLNQPGSGQFQDDMGDYYQDWSDFLKTQSALPGGDLLELFNSWSQLHMPAGQAMQCYTDLANIYQGPVYSALQLWINAGGSRGGSNKAYTITVEQLRTKIAQAPPAHFNMDSRSQSNDISHTWARGYAAGWFGLFGKDKSFDEYSMTLISKGLTIEAEFNHVLTIPAGPLNQVSHDPILSKYKPWFNAGTLNLAYNNKTVWKNNPPTWDDKFGPNGTLLRLCSALVIVDGISITTESDAIFTTDQQQTIQRHGAVDGFWPFYISSGSGGASNNFHFDEKGKMTYNCNSPVGNPVILGVIVTPIENALMYED